MFCWSSWPCSPSSPACLSFVFYADNEAESARLSVAGQNIDVPDIDPEALLGYFLSNVIYGTNNPYSAGRGWEFSRSIYGYNPASLNFTPYNGLGRKNGFAPTTNDPDIGAPMYNMINYQTFYNPAQAANIMRLARILRQHPVRGSSDRPDADHAQWQLSIRRRRESAVDRLRHRQSLPRRGDGRRHGAAPVLFAAMEHSQGLAGVPAAQQAQVAKYLSLSPDPTWNPNFYPLPDQDPYTGMQVKNLDNGPGGNDSNWMDWGHPIMTAANGKRYKPLFAPLIVDLSNRLHLWAHGNNLGGSTTAPPGVSQMGFGPPEVNLNTLPSVRTVIASATEKGGLVTVTTGARTA